MAGEAPGGAAVHAGGGEGGEAQLVLAGGDVLDDSLQGLEVGDVLNGIAGLGQQSLVDDDAVALIAVTDGADLALGILQDVSVGVQLVEHIGAGQIVAELAPGVHSGGVAHDEHGGSLVLIHLGGQGVVVGAGSSGHDLDGHTGLLGVQASDLLQSLVGLGLEVQPVNTAGSLGALIGSGSLLAASDQTQNHDQGQHQSKKLFHTLIISF